jgi:hypothetical protein
VSQRPAEPVVLNAGGPMAAALPLGALGAELRARIATIVARHADPATGCLDYRALRATADFRAFADATRVLRAGRPGHLASPAEQIAFWVNLYNALVLHGIVALDIRQSVGEVHEFFFRVQYDVGGHGFSLVDIEHGVLRRNQPAENLPVPPFAAGDGRLGWLVARVDPRIHFALMCGTRSCPPIRAYDATALDAQLDLATRSFVNADVEIDPGARRVTLSRIFHWYQVDFGDVLGFVLRHLDPDPRRDWLATHRDEVAVVHRAYDWTLNDAAALRP